MNFSHSGKILDSMRTRLIFSLNNVGAMLPFHHQHLIANFLQWLLKKNKSEYATFKNYTISAVKGKLEVSKGGLKVLSNKVTVVITSLNDGFIEQTIDYIFKEPRIQIGELILTPLYTEKEELAEMAEETKYLCLAPMVLVSPLESTKDAVKYINPFSDDFSDLLYESTMNKMEESGLYSPQDLVSFSKFQVIPDKEYLLRFKNEDQKYTRIFTIYENGTAFPVRGYTFPFSLFAAKEVQEFIYFGGFGCLNYKGYGMLDVYKEMKEHTPPPIPAMNSNLPKRQNVVINVEK